MTDTLVTFLGRAAHDPGTGYRCARYRFADGTVRETAFFGLALREHLAPERLVVLGTEGSMWDVLIEHLAGKSDQQYGDRRLALLEAVEHGTVDSSHLDALRPLAEEALGVACDLVLIPYARSLDEQVRLLDDLAETVGAARGVHIDVTHGLRHLAMLALVGAHYLEALSRTLSVERIWYAALELAGPNSEAPVIELQGLLRLQRWVEALRRFEDDGDYAVFAELLEQDGVDPEGAAALRQAAYLESVLNLPDARRRLQAFLPLLEEPLPGAARLFARRLRERLSWVAREDLYQHQRRLAHLHLAKGDFLRAAILANEAVLTRRMRERGEGDVNRQEDRERARDALLEEMKQATRDAEHEDYRALAAIRNAIAHGSVPRWERIRRLLLNRDRLRAELERIMSRLLT